MVGVADRRRARNLSQEDLVRATGCSVRTIRRIETDPGYTPSVRTVLALARALDCDPLDFMDLHVPERTTCSTGRGNESANETPRRRDHAPGHGSTEETREHDQQ